MKTQEPTAGAAGRFIRLVLGVCLVILAAPVYLRAGWRYNLSSLGLALGLLVIYTLMHVLMSRVFAGLNRWIGSVVAVIPVFLFWYFGQGGGLLFGQGEGGTAAITFLAISFVVDFARSDSGCEVMALPGLILGDRTHLPCLLLCPIDHAEARAGGAEGASGA